MTMAIALSGHRRGVAPLVVAGALMLAGGFALVLSPSAARAQGSFGLSSFSTELSDTQAGAHPNVNVSFALNTDSEEEGRPIGQLRRVKVELPPGLIGNPQAIPQCTPHEFEEVECKSSSEVGVMETSFILRGEVDKGPIPIYNLTPSAGHVATFGISVLLFSMLIQLNVTHHDGSYGLTAEINDIPTYVPIGAASLDLWGVPGDPSHEQLRVDELGTLEPRPATVAVVPFMTNSTDCESGPMTTTISVEPWEDHGEQVQQTTTMPAPTGCERLTMAPTISVAPGTTQVDSPSGYEFTLKVPQKEESYGMATPDLRTIEVTLPAGTSLSPAAANGLQGCSDEQLAASGCPNASKIGTTSLRSPLLHEPLTGTLYLGTPTPTQPYRIFLTASGDSVTVNLGGQLTLNSSNGQPTVTFEDVPQLPFEELHLGFFGGPGAVLANPATCGPASTSSKITSYSEQVASPSSMFVVDANGNGGACPASQPFSPGFSAGSVSALAGGFSQFTLTVSREDGQQDLSTVAAQLPQGLLALLSRVAPCAEAAAVSGSCPPSALVGSATVAAGPGSQPLYLQGQVYLTGPYAGAPFGLAIVVPAEAGPFHLGTIVVRARILVNPKTLQLTIASDPLPQILDGIPLRLRMLNLTIDREGLVFNPTDCAPQTIGATIGSAVGASAQVSSPFQVGGCAGLPFAPKLTASTQAKASAVGDGASLDVNIASGAGAANLRSVIVQLPARLQSRLSTIQQACAAAAFAARPSSCPAASLVGTATAQTPVLSAPLSGGIYLVSHGQSSLPGLVMALQGDGITVELEGVIKISKQGVTTSAFRELPDVPLTSLSLDLPAGPHSVLGATGSLCAKALGLPYTLTAQSGAEIQSGTRVAVSGCAKKRRRRG